MKKLLRILTNRIEAKVRAYRRYDCSCWFVVKFKSLIVIYRKRDIILLMMRVWLLFISLTIFALMVSCPEVKAPPGDFPGEEEPPVVHPDPVMKLLILQVGVWNNDRDTISHSFVELYNAGTQAVDLTGYSLQYASGHTSSASVKQDGAWAKINLSGSIHPNNSFLIRGDERTVSGVQTAPMQVPQGDMNVPGFRINNRAAKIILLSSTTPIESVLQNPLTDNPFNIDNNGTKVAGYVDMLGGVNTVGTDLIRGFESSVGRRLTGSQVLRRVYRDDTDDNELDFENINYSNETNEVKGEKGPRRSGIAWYLPKAPLVTEPKSPTESLMILQANSIGNHQGGGFQTSLVELYNNTSAAINLTTGNYYLHIGDSDGWKRAIKLNGVIPKQCSFLVVGNVSGTGIYRAPVPAPDQSADFNIAVDNFMIAVFKNQNNILSVNNPFNDPLFAKDYVDMVGSGTVKGFETNRPIYPATAPRSLRRNSLTDNDDNSIDFDQTDFRAHTASNGMTDAELYKFWPRNSGQGAWNPITGIPRKDPVPIIPGETTDAGPKSSYAGKLLIFQVGPSASDGAIGRSFIELYNNTNASIDLKNFSLQYGTEGVDWKKINLTKTIPAKSSYLIVGEVTNSSTANLVIANAFSDQVEPVLKLNNDGFKVVLIESQYLLSVNNPFAMPGGSAAGYVDMFGATNDDVVDAWETIASQNTAPSGLISKNRSARRKSLNDTDSNLNDFERIDYRAENITQEKLQQVRPRYSGDGSWAPF